MLPAYCSASWAKNPESARRTMRGQRWAMLQASSLATSALMRSIPCADLAIGMPRALRYAHGSRTRGPARAGAGRPRGDDHQPRQALLPRAGRHEARARRVLPGGGRWRAAGRARPADGAQALRRRRRRGGILPEARPEIGPECIAHGGAVVPLRPHRGRGGGRQRGRAGVGRQPRLHRPQPAPGAVRRSRAPRRAARRPRPRPRACRGPTSARWRWSSREVLEELGYTAGRRRPARAASTSTSGSSRAGASPRCGAAALALAREVERRAPDIATSKWWKEERHGVFLDYNQNAKDRTVASAYSVRPSRPRRSARRYLGRGARRRARRLHDPHACRPATHASATSAPGSTSGPSRSSRCSSS